MRRSAWVATALGGAVGALGIAATGGRYLAKGCTLPPIPPPPPDNVTVRDEVFESRVLGKRVGITRIDPLERVASQARRVCFALPGRGETASSQARGLHLDGYLGEVLRQRGAPAMTLVIVDGGESYWHARDGGEDRMRMLLDEVVRPLVGPRGEFDASRSRAGILGWSMGAYGAILAAITKPEIFSTLCASSPALWRSATEQERAVPDAFDDAADYDRNDVFSRVARLRNTRVRVDCGLGDPFYDAARTFVGKMAADGQHPETNFAAGCHNGAFWQSTAYDDLSFVARCLS